MTELGFAVVGCGRMGTRRARTIANHPSALLVAVSDECSDRAEVVAHRRGCRAISDVAELLALEDVNTVFVCTPNKFHASVALAAMRHGKHVICEKPLARNPHEATAMVREAAVSGVTLKVGANVRFFANVRKAWELVNEGTVGDLLFLRGWIGNGGWQTSSWFGNPELSGGGTVLDNGCHLFDLIRWLLGDLATCSGQVTSLYWDLDVEDNGTGIFMTSDGRMATVSTSWTEWTEYLYLDVYGSQGLVTVDNRLPAERTVLVRRDDTREVFEFSGSRGDPYARELASYLEARERGDVPQPDGLDGLRVVEMAHAIYESSRCGRRILLHQDGRPR